MDQPSKKCCTCGTVRPLTEFNKRRSAPDGLQARCRSCSRLWYVANAATHKANVRRRNDEQRRVLQQHLATYLRDHPCVDCGEDDVRCLEFDHRDRATKSAEVSRLLTGSVSWDVLLREIEKCDVRCANCHRRRTASQFSTWRQRAATSRSSGSCPDSLLWLVDALDLPPSLMAPCSCSGSHDDP